MNGTSAAAPNVTGVIALMLEANPKLTVRDLKYILAKTAQRIDREFSGVSANDIVPGHTIALEDGWVTNKALPGGWRFSNRYGFGAVDAAAAVAMAKSYTDQDHLPPVQTSGVDSLLPTPPGTVARMSPTGTSVIIPISPPFNIVESVIVMLNIEQTPDIGCNQVELTSPAGTKSILIHYANGFSNSSLVDSRILSNAFYGERADGEWKLTFFDFCSPGAIPTQLSTTLPQSLVIVGH
jgi:hypothetical protein